MSVIGNCRFNELPEAYQTLFEDGGNRIEDGEFYAAKYPVALTIMGLLFIAFFTTIPLAVLLDYNIPRFSLLGVLLQLPLVIVAAFAFRTVSMLIRFQQKKKKGALMYGLIIDKKNVVLHRMEPFKFKNAVLIPRDHIMHAYARFTTGRAANKKPSTFRVNYLDENGESVWIDLVGKNDIELTLSQLEDLFQRLQKDGIEGEWSRSQMKVAEVRSDTILRFDKPDGVILDYLEGKKITEIHFTYKMVGEREIEVISVEGGQKGFGHQLHPGRYSFSLKVDRVRQRDSGKYGRYYILRFDTQFYEPQLTDYGQPVSEK